MPGAFDFKKEYRDLYMPKAAPMTIEVPEMRFLMIDGAGDPNGAEYGEAVGALYALAYTVKMSKMGARQPDGYFDYVVPPLEGLWWCEGDNFSLDRRDNWLWTAMIRQPDFVTEQVLEWAIAECKKKKPEVNPAKAYLTAFTEGLCVQMMHHGPYATEPETVETMRRYMEQNGLRDEIGAQRKHHEIYLSDPRKTEPDKLRTVLRHPAGRV